MEHISKKSRDKRSCYKRFLIISILLGIILIQVSVTTYSSTVLAVPRVNCINPTPANNGTSAPPAPATPGIVLINEVLPSPASQWNCLATGNGFNQENMWIEIYNPQNQPFDLYTARASIDYGQGAQPCTLPFGSIIAPHGFFTFFPFMNDLSNCREQPSFIRLVISQVVIDQVSLPSLAPDTSYARIPDGSDNWQITTYPTIDSSNTLSTITPTSQATKTVAETTKTASQATKTAKTKSATSVPTQTTKRQATSTKGSSTSNDEASVDPSTTEVQPTWSALRLPISRSDNTTLDNTAQQNSSPPSVSSPSSVPSANSSVLLSKILLTLLSVAFILALLGCWRLYQRRKSMRP